MTNVKFRGIDSKTGKMVYGAYDQYTGQILTADFSDERKIVDVMYQNVELLLGYDADGNEVYEGDTVLYDGKPVKLKLKVCVGNEPIGWVGASFRVLKGEM